MVGPLGRKILFLDYTFDRLRRIGSREYVKPLSGCERFSIPKQLLRAWGVDEALRHCPKP